MNEIYIGLMSGTSVDGIDAALVDFKTPVPSLLAHHYLPCPAHIRKEVLDLCKPGHNEIERMGALDIDLGVLFADAALSVLKKASLKARDVQAIGSHGQTVRHAPFQTRPFTLQIGDPNTIAAQTGITTVADFRRYDIACGGQGAPLVPAFHHYLFTSSSKDRAIVNIGGIANLTILRHDHQKAPIGYDTGPGNVLIDGWFSLYHANSFFDAEGAWGAQGTVDAHLLEQLLADKYFQLPPPKSTGREHFNLAWLNQYLCQYKTGPSPIDVQATLVELTASTIIKAVKNELLQGEVLVCGGGAHNTFLMSRLKSLAGPRFELATTQSFGAPPDYLEAMAFAWFARQRLRQMPGNIPSVTGAKQAVILGGVYCGR